MAEGRRQLIEYERQGRILKWHYRKLLRELNGRMKLTKI